VWVFLIQAYPLPEHMIGLDPKFYLQHIFDGLNKTPGAIGPDEMNEYIRAFCNADAIHSTCEDFRAAAGIDLEWTKPTIEPVERSKRPLHAGRKGNSRRLVGRDRYLAGEICCVSDGEASRLWSLSARRKTRGSHNGITRVFLSPKRFLGCATN
jgi:hypothetical protein